MLVIVLEQSRTTTSPARNRKMSEAEMHLFMIASIWKHGILAVLKTIESDSKVKAISATKDMVPLFPRSRRVEDTIATTLAKAHSHEYDPHVWLSPERDSNGSKHYEAASGRFPEAAKKLSRKTPCRHIEKLTALGNDLYKCI